MSQVTEERVLEALQNVADPDKGRDVVSLGMVTALQIREGHVALALQVEPQRGPHLEPLRKEAERVVWELPGVLSATVALTAERLAPPSPPAAPQAPPQAAPGGAPGGAPGPEQLLLPGVRAIIAVASGKGGVGKSTTAVNLALALKSLGLRVGVFDADIFGPSVPRMLGISGKPSSADEIRLAPMENYGIKCMSMGFLVEEETPVIWRGPMVMRALEQMMRDVAWGELDVMVVDMPPGTGDTQLTMSQRVPLAGVVIVSTPQEIALADARKGLNMFRRVNVPVLGLVENMSYFQCPDNGKRYYIFGRDGVKREAARSETDFLGEIPLDTEIRETSDAGHPIVIANPDGEHAHAYRAIAEKVWAKILARLEDDSAQGPRILVE